MTLGNPDFGHALVSICPICGTEFRYNGLSVTQMEGAFVHEEEVELWEQLHRAKHLEKGTWKEGK